MIFFKCNFILIHNILYILSNTKLQFYITRGGFVFTMGAVRPIGPIARIPDTVQKVSALLLVIVKEAWCVSTVLVRCTTSCCMEIYS